MDIKLVYSTKAQLIAMHNELAKAEFKLYNSTKAQLMCNEFTNLHMIVKWLLPNYFKTLGEGPVRRKKSQ